MVLIFCGAALLSFVWAMESIDIMFKYDALLTLIGLLMLYGMGHYLYRALKNFEDPDYDWTRAAALVFAIFAIVVFAGYKIKYDDSVEHNIQPPSTQCSTHTSDCC